MTTTHFILDWFRHDDIPDFCAVVIVCGKPFDVIATGDTETELLANLDRESMRQRVPRANFTIVDMRLHNTLHRGAIELLRATQARIDADRPTHLVNDGDGWERERIEGCRIIREPWPWGL